MPLVYNGTPIFLEPGHVYKLEENTNLFLLDPLNETKSHGQFDDRTITKQAYLPKGTKVFATRVSHNPGPLIDPKERETVEFLYKHNLQDQAFYVATFAPKGEDNLRRDLNKGVKILKTGYVLTDNMAYAGQRYELTSRNIYATDDDPHNDMPKPEHIYQGNIGNCFFLSAVSALLHSHGAECIESMMVQEGNTTVVRFFDPLNEYKPVYVRVENSKIALANGDAYSHHKADWPDILAKAFVGFARDFAPNGQCTTMFPAHEPAFGIGGFSSTVFNILVGPNVKVCKVERQLPWDSTSIEFAHSAAELYDVQMRANLPEDAIIEALEAKREQLKEEIHLYSILTIRELIAWSRFYKQHEHEWDEYIRPGLILTSADYAANLSKLETLSRKDINAADLSSVFDKFKLEIFGTKKIEKTDVDNQAHEVSIPNYPTPKDHPTYTQYQWDVWNQFKKAADDEDAITLVMGNKINEAGVLDFHEPVTGILPAHVYSVVEVYEDEKKIKRVKLSNPHGEGGRKSIYYDDAKSIYMASAKTSAGISDLTLDEVCQFVYSYTICSAVNQDPILNVSESENDTASSSSVLTTSDDESYRGVDSESEFDMPKGDLIQKNISQIAKKSEEKQLKEKFRLDAADKIEILIRNLNKEIKDLEKSCLAFCYRSTITLKKAKSRGLMEIYSRILSAMENNSEETLREIISQVRYATPGFYAGYSSRTEALCEKLIEEEAEKNWNLKAPRMWVNKK